MFRAVSQLLLDYGTKYPRAEKAVADSRFVDGIPCGENTVEEFRVLKDELVCLTKLGGFELIKWASSRPQIFQNWNMEFFYSSLELLM